MGMFSFIKEAGEKLFGIGEAKATEVVAKKDPTPVNVDAANRAAANELRYISQRRHRTPLRGHAGARRGTNYSRRQFSRLFIKTRGAISE